MAGVSDRPYRQIALSWGAGLAVSEMLASDPRLYRTAKSRLRRVHLYEGEPRSVQLLGADPATMAEAARYNVERGAQIIDINMGCPAKKVCNTFAGSALLEDEGLVGSLLESVVAAVDVPVTLKIRTGPDVRRRNGVTVARIAEAAGVKALAVHGRTRACRFAGCAEYETIAEIKACVSIPVIANGDIDSPQKAKWVLDRTSADGVMLGRAAQGRPWLFGQIAEYLRRGELPADPPLAVQRDTALQHLEALYTHHGSERGVKIARKHIRWYTKNINGGEQFWRYVNRIGIRRQQYQAVRNYYNSQIETYSQAA